MKGARGEDQQYRRGVVLGLTMAEIMLLLIFLLLLILAARMIETEKESFRLVELQQKAETEKKKAEDKAAALQEQLDQIQKSDPKKFDLTKEYQKLEAEKRLFQEEQARNKTAMDLFEEFKAENKKMTAEEAAKEMARLAEIGREIEKQASELMPAAGPDEAMKHLMAAAEVGDAAIKSGASPEDLVENASCSADLKTCMSTNDGLSVALAKKGGTLPSCWRDPLTQSIQYIFTAYLRSDGILLEAINIPGRDRSTLPLGALTAGKIYSRSEFVAAGQTIYRWSDNADPPCRFYVRAIDQTGIDKAQYVSMKEKGVEQIFFVKKD